MRAFSEHNGCESVDVSLVVCGAFEKSVAWCALHDAIDRNTGSGELHVSSPRGELFLFALLWALP